MRGIRGKARALFTSRGVRGIGGRPPSFCEPRNARNTQEKPALSFYEPRSTQNGGRPSLLCEADYGTRGTRGINQRAARQKSPPGRSRAVAILSTSRGQKPSSRVVWRWQALCDPPDMRDDLLHGDVTEQIIGGFYEVHYELGGGFLEYVFITSADRSAPRPRTAGGGQRPTPGALPRQADTPNFGPISSSIR